MVWISHDSTMMKTRIISPAIIYNHCVSNRTVGYKGKNFNTTEHYLPTHKMQHDK